MMLDKEKVEKYRAFSFLGVGEKLWLSVAIGSLMIVYCFVWLDKKPFPYIYAGCVSLFCVWCASHQRKYHLAHIFGDEKKTFFDCFEEYVDRTIFGWNAWYFTNDGKPNGNVEHCGIQLYPSVDSAALVLPLGGWWNRPQIYFRYGNVSMPEQHLAFRIRSYSIDTQSVTIDDGKGSVVEMAIYDAIAVLNEYGARQGNTSWCAIFEAMREEKNKLQDARDTLVRELQQKMGRIAELDRERMGLLRDRQDQIETTDALLEERKAHTLTIEETSRSLDQVINYIDQSSRLRMSKEGKWVLELLLIARIAMAQNDHGLLTRYELMLEALRNKKKVKLARR